ncbi:MAG TPA: helix-turn-helix domain-containing protein, partial [Candidatus Dormibacteraeota bacterium]|nr:helix-turn-helix domain-containing protein [Candidatus Dormibacteraeota bacterium]
MAARRVEVVEMMISCGLSERQQERVWEMWSEGRSSYAMARILGTYKQYVLRCVHATGGIKPAPRKRAECQLSRGEREEISRGLACEDSFRAIGRAIGRPHTTVSREVNRNGGRRRYRAEHAEEAAWERARRPKPSKLGLNSRLRAVV